MTRKLELSIFSISVEVTVILATLMITAVTYDLTDLVLAQEQKKFEFNLTGSDFIFDSLFFVLSQSNLRTITTIGPVGCETNLTQLLNPCLYYINSNDSK
jgi:hypothetical protein